MKNTLFCLIFFLLVIPFSATKAQSKLNGSSKRILKNAQYAFYEDQDYNFIISSLIPINDKYPDNAEVNYRLGQSMILTRDYKHNALPFLKKAVELGIEEANFELGLAYHLNYEFTNALTAFLAYQKIEEREYEDLKILRNISMVRKAEELTAHPTEVIIENLGRKINTEWHDYAPIITADESQLYFTSRRSNSTGGNLDANDDFYEDIYTSSKHGGEWIDAKNIGMPFNTYSHDATVGLSSSGNTMLLYRTNDNLIGGDLYISELEFGAWSAPKKMDESINSIFQEASACISPDEKTLYFSSNRPGGFGGKDIYLAKKLPNGKWSLPQNLGPQVNTHFDEDAPFIHIDGKTLYFSSNGHITMGGYDVFKSKYQGRGGWSAATNLGYPINTVNDDLFFSINGRGDRAYYSSDRKNGYGGLDLYGIKLPKAESNIIVVHGRILDENKVPLKAQITVLENKTCSLEGIYNSNANSGKFILALKPNKSYRTLVECEGYLTRVEDISILQEKGVKEAFKGDIILETK